MARALRIGPCYNQRSSPAERDAGRIENKQSSERKVRALISINKVMAESVADEVRALATI